MADTIGGHRSDTRRMHVGYDNDLGKHVARHQQDSHADTSVDYRGKGRCWTCNRTDMVYAYQLSICAKCREKIDYEEGVMSTINTEKGEYCMYHAEWVWLNEDVYTISVNVCERCTERLGAMWANRDKVDRKGIEYSNPGFKKIRKALGKDWREIHDMVPDPKVNNLVWRQTQANRREWYERERARILRELAALDVQAKRIAAERQRVMELARAKSAKEFAKTDLGQAVAEAEAKAGTGTGTDTKTAQNPNQ